MERSAPDLATFVRTPLSEAHVARLREIGDIVTFAPGETMVAFGGRSDALYYILDGEAAAYDEVSGTRYGDATLGPTQFTGEMSLLTGGAAMLSNRAVGPVTAIRVARPALLEALADIPEMSDIVITVLAARRRRLIESGKAGLTLIGAVSCCRFRGHEDKIVTKETESGYDETEVQPRVQDRGRKVGDGSGCGGSASRP